MKTTNNQNQEANQILNHLNLGIMQAVNSLIAVIVFSLFTFTSCQKDEMYDLDKQVNRNMSLDRTEVTTSSSNRKAQAINMVYTNAQTFDLTGAQVPNDNARSSHACRIRCSTGPVYDSNRGSSNKIDQRNMKCEYGGDSFKGADKFYYFKAENSDQIDGSHRYQITLSDLEDDLDLFVYTLDAQGYVRECKGVSISIGANLAESIELVGLNEGYYLVVVDAYAEEVYSSYTLELTCDVVQEATPCWDLNGNGKADLNEDVNFDHVVNEEDCIASALKSVKYEDDGQLPGELTGSFTQDGDSHRWVEIIKIANSNSVEAYEYEEMGRDMWTIYLQDFSREISVEIDIAHNRIVAKQDGNGFASFKITSKSFRPGGVPTTGQNLSKVSISKSGNGIFEGGIEKVEGTSQWREYNAEGIYTAFYREVTRDEWSVYLLDESNNINIQLDTYNQRVNILGINWSFLYQIVSMQ